MKRLPRIESWLLIVPGIVILVEWLFFGNSAIDIHLQDTYYVIAHFYFGIGFLVVLIIPCLFHFFLRLVYKRSGRICEAHVLCSLIIILVFFIIAETGDVFTRHYTEYSDWMSYQVQHDYFLLLILLFILLQLLFIIYAIFRLIFRSSRNA